MDFDLFIKVKNQGNNLQDFIFTRSDYAEMAFAQDNLSHSQKEKLINLLQFTGSLRKKQKRIEIDDFEKQKYEM